MLRKWTLGIVTALALAVPAVVTPSVEASHPINGFQRHHCCYRVLYRSCWCDPWACYGCFDCFCEANQVACGLRHQGYVVRIVRS